MSTSLEAIRVRAGLVELLQAPGNPNKDLIERIFTTSETTPNEVLEALTFVHRYMKENPIYAGLKKKQLVQLRDDLNKSTAESKDLDEISLFYTLWLSVHTAVMFYELGLEVGSKRERS